jgi:Trk K+ transport system NAD-binding subunit
MKAKDEFEVADARIVVVEEDATGAPIARRLLADGATVTLVTGNAAGAATMRRAGADVALVDTIEGTALDLPAVRDADWGVLSCRSDSRALLLAQFLRRYGCEHVVVLVDDPRTADAFTAAKVEPLLRSHLLSADALRGPGAGASTGGENADAPGGR